MKLFILLSLLLSAVPSLAVPGRQGADVVHCRPSSANPYKGFYSLDFLAQYSPSHPVVAEKPFEKLLEDYEKFLDVKLPEMSVEFTLFRAGLFAEDPRHIYQWEQAPFGLVDLHDENLVSLIPENCREGNVIKVTQAIVLIPPDQTGRGILVKYVPEVIEDLRRNNPVQLSFLVLRTFMINFKTTVDQGRRLTYYFNTEHIRDWSRRRWNEVVRAIGLELPETSPPFFVSSYCMKNDPVEEAKLISNLRPNQVIGMGVTPYGFEYAVMDPCPDPNPASCSYIDLIDYKYPMKKLHLEPAIRMMYTDGALWLMSDNGGGAFAPLKRHLACEIDLARKKFGKCGDFTNKDGNKLTVPNPFRVIVNGNCVNVMTGKVQRNPDGTKTYAMLTFLLDL